jgi:hypothetical protein
MMSDAALSVCWGERCGFLEVVAELCSDCMPVVQLLLESRWS